MESVVRSIFEELQAGYHNSFVLTQNIRDHVWEEDDPDPFSFTVGLCRRLSCGSQELGPFLVAYYALSRGFRLYLNGESVRDQKIEQSFRERTGLGELLNVEVMGPDRLQNLIREPDAILPRLTGFLATGDVEQYRCCLVIDSIDNLVSLQHDNYQLGDRAVLEILENWSWDSRIQQRKNSIVLLCSERSRIPGGLIRVDGGYRVFPVRYPNEAERQQFLQERFETEKEEAARIANLTTGFRRIELAEVRMRKMSDDQIAARKAEIIRNRCADSIELVESTFGLERASAQPHVREYLRELCELMTTNRKDPSIPTGLLFVGVPGNGKSHITRAFAHDCGMNMLRFKNVRNSLVGESERNLNTVLDILPALAPCVVFIDEIDQVLHSRGNFNGGDMDGGVESRLLARMLEFMGDTSHRGDIIWIGATNRPDLLDPAMPRRFGRVFPFMNPTEQAREGLIQDLVTRLGLPFSTDFDYHTAAREMQDYSCDDVEKVVLRAREVAFRSNKGQSLIVTNDHLAATCRSFKHNYNPRMYEFIGLLSVEICNFVSDLPWCDDEGNIDISIDDLPWFLQNMVEGNRISMTLVNQRLEELRSNPMGIGVAPPSRSRILVENELR